MEKNKIFNVLGWISAGIAAAYFFLFGFSKIIGTEESVSNFEFMKLSPYMLFIGIAEVVGATLLLIPRTSVYGALILSSVMSGAVAIHLSVLGGVGLITPIFLGVISWASHCLRTYNK